MVIPEAVLRVKLEEKVLDKRDSTKHILQLAELTITNLSSITDAHRRSIPEAELDDWKAWVLDNMKLLLERAVCQVGVKQWLHIFSESPSSIPSQIFANSFHEPLFGGHYTVG
ncbi:unnamed protein product [Dibothriocephalus latus]|uniref:Uncharacterized protein n=1 Tax=Dibothriocephalus latus TaxID=60516 RepID=A0A3P6R3L8_DIBLA|nr:unnamed protein product [Dibothriocephalus latus]